MLIAADVGGTNSRLGLFERDGNRPQPVATREYDTRRFGGFGEILRIFANDVGTGMIEAAAVGVAGPIVEQQARLTNIAWQISAADIASHLGIGNVRLLNDLEAMATAVPVLRADELETFRSGTDSPDGNAAIIAAGTGLGEAYLPRVDGRLRVLPSEAGHADFAARTDREMSLVQMLRSTYGRASVEHVISGPGLVNLYRFTHPAGQPCAAVPNPNSDDAAARVSQAGLEHRCPHCVEALEMFVEALGAEAGNLGLRGTATAGVFIGGGIAPKILPALRMGGFLEAFLDKAPMDTLVARMPLHVILNTDAGLLGAAVAADRLES